MSGGAAAAAAAAAVAGLRRAPMTAGLCVLDLSGLGLGDAGIAALAPCLARAPYLRSLSLADNRVRDPGAAELAAALKLNSGLTHLNLSWNGLRSSAPALADALRV